MLAFNTRLLQNQIQPTNLNPISARASQEPDPAPCTAQGSQSQIMHNYKVNYRDSEGIEHFDEIEGCNPGAFCKL